MADISNINEAAGEYWDKKLEEARVAAVTRVRWWEDETIKRHINRIVSGWDIDAVHAAFHQRIASFFSGREGLKAVSVGCGTGYKEMWLMEMASFRHFDLYDISKANIAAGREEAIRRGILSQVNLAAEDAFAADLGSDYDLVYWNNALHHMPSVDDAIQWSKERLKSGGLLALDDFIGPNRFQWTDENIKWATKVRESLPDRFLRNPYSPDHLLPRQVSRPSVEEVIASDPSEAVDPAATIPALRRHFPDAEVIPTGGALYHLGLNDMICNFIGEEDLLLLQQILLLDQALAEHGTTHYAVAFAVKP